MQNIEQPEIIKRVVDALGLEPRTDRLWAGCSEPLSHQLPNIPKNIQTISEPYLLQTNPEWARRTFQRVSASANPNIGMPYPDGGGSYGQVPLCSITRARALILPHSFACYCFLIPKPATGRGENVSLTWLIYNMLKNSPTESFFQKFFIFFFFFFQAGLRPPNHTSISIQPANAIVSGIFVCRIFFSAGRAIEAASGLMHQQRYQVLYRHQS